MRQGNLLGVSSQKVKRFMGTLHRPPRQHLVLTGGLPERLTTYEGKVTIPWEFDLCANGPQLRYCGVQVTLPSPVKSS